MRFRGLAAAILSMACVALASCSPSSRSASDGDYPSRPVHIVVGFGVGGPDTTARLLAAQLSAQTGRRFVIDNKPGSSGMIGAEAVAKAKPDGYTLLIAPASLATLPSLHRKLSFDVPGSFTPISQIAASEASFLVVPPALPAKTLKDFMAYARDPANRVAYASTGIGTGSHLRMALFSEANDLDLVHVPFKSPGEAVVAVMGGQVQALFLTTTQAQPLIKAGKVRALAYDYSTRASFLPEVPTLEEAGSASVKHLNSGWNGLLAPAGTPPAVVEWLEREVRKAITDPQVQQRLKNLGLTPVGGSSEEFQQVLVRTVSEMQTAARSSGIKPQ